MLTLELPRSSSRFSTEVATSQDDFELRDLFHRTPMGDGIEVSFEREPSYFNVLGIQGDKFQVGIIRDRNSNRIVGCGSRAVREGFLNGEITEIGYLGDMRIDPEYRKGTLAARLYRLLRSGDRWCDWYYTVIFEENTQALSTLAAGRAGLPKYHDHGRVLCPGIELGKKLPALHLPRISLRQATDWDIPEIVDCLNRNLIRRQFSTVHRVEHFRNNTRWPSLESKHFCLAEKHGKIIGVMASWDQLGFKQTRVVNYRDRWRRLAPASRWLAPLRGVEGLPRIGECISFLYACCFAVDDDDMDIFRALLREVYNSSTGKQWLYLMIGLHENDPFIPAVSEYKRIPFAGRLFAVTLSDPSEQLPELDDRVPSIEISTL